MLGVILLSLFSRLPCAHSQIVSSCPQTGVTSWNEADIGASLRSWLKSVTTVTYKQEDGLKSMRYYPETDKYGPHFDTEDLSDLHDNPADTGRTFTDDLELVDTDAEKGYITISHFEAGSPRGLTWRWQSERILEGFLYGDLEDGGRFTGDDLIYIYPDLETGLRGRFVDGEAVAVRSVLLTSERCNQGLREVRTRNTEDATTWRRRLSDRFHISDHPLVMEPHEARSVILGDSTQVTRQIIETGMDLITGWRR